MRASLKKAFDAAARLPETAQDSIASLILDEIAADRVWDERFSKSQGALEELARRARTEVARGDVLNFDPSDRRET